MPDLSPPLRARVLDALAEILPLPLPCEHCNPAGGCPHPFLCRLDLAEDVLAVMEREAGNG